MNGYWLICLVFFGAALADIDIARVLNAVKKEVRTGTFSALIEITETFGVSRVDTSRPIRRTTTVEEFHDAVEGIHALHFTGDATGYFYFAKAQPKTLIRSNQVNCSTLPLKENGAQFFFQSGDPFEPEFVLGPTGLVLTIPAVRADAVQDCQIRGINCYSWRFYSMALNAVIEVYFAADEWVHHLLSLLGEVPFPLRIIQLLPDDIKLQMDIFHVERPSPGTKGMTRITERLLPPFVSKPCVVAHPAGLDQPVMPKKASFFTEAFFGEMIVTKEWFDLTLEATRCESDLWLNNTTGDRILRQVTDERLGLVFTLSESQCTPTPVGPNVEALQDGSLCPGSLVYHALRQTNKTYVGKSLIRGLSVDVWQVTGNQEDLFQAARIYVTSDNITMASPFAGQIDYHVPLQVDFRTFDPDDEHDTVIRTVQLFNFASTNGNDEFDDASNLVDCLTDRTFVEILLRSSAPFNVSLLLESSALNELTKLLKSAVLNITEISPLRLAYNKLTVEDSSDVIATLELLEAPSLMKSFRKREDQFQIRFSGKIEPISADTEVDCALACAYSNEQKACATFIYCDSWISESCYLMPSPNVSDWGEPEEIEDGTICEAFDNYIVGGTLRNPASYRTLEEVTGLLKDRIEGSRIEFAITAGAEGSITFRAWELTPDVTQFNDRSNDRPYSLELQQNSIRGRHPASQVAKGISTVGECYRQCISNESIACGVFSFCPKQGENACIFSSLNIHFGNHDPEQEKATLFNPDCNIYAVRYLDQFERQPGRPVDVQASAEDHGVRATDCAIKCRQFEYDSMVSDCRAFDFCAEQKHAECRFYDMRYSTSNDSAKIARSLPSLHSQQRNEHRSKQNKSTPGCVHYVLRPSADYIAIGRWIPDVAGTTEILGISADGCAKRCSELSDGKCISLAHCRADETTDRQQSCLLYPVKLEDAPSSHYNRHCTFYSRSTDVTEMIRPSRQQVKKKEPNVIYEELPRGTMALICISMLLVGLVIGVSAYSYRGRISEFVTARRNRHQDSGTAESLFPLSGIRTSGSFSSPNRSYHDPTFTQIDL